MYLTSYMSAGYRYHRVVQGVWTDGRQTKVYPLQLGRLDGISVDRVRELWNEVRDLGDALLLSKFLTTLQAYGHDVRHLPIGPMDETPSVVRERNDELAHDVGDPADPGSARRATRSEGAEDSEQRLQQAPRDSLRATVRDKYLALAPTFNERARRLWAAAEANAIGHGGITIVSEATGMTRKTIRSGIQELKDGPPADLAEGKLRRPGAGRKQIVEVDPTLLEDLEKLVDPVTRGDPESALRWTCKGTAVLADALKARGHNVSARTVAKLLKGLQYSLQANRKTREGNQHKDRNAQFEHIYLTVEKFRAAGEPVISVDTKKKELVGDFKNGGREWQPKGHPEEVRVHDFLDENLGKAIPYGTYDIARNEGWVNVGIDHDTSAFAVESIRQWWKHMGRAAYPNATKLLITADGGGSNGSRRHAWKTELQAFSQELEIPISMCHFPPGTSKWNKIEHRMFSAITRNWRGRPLESLEVIINLIASTKTKTGLKIGAAVDDGNYPVGVKVSKEELAALRIERDEFHGEWNYALMPSSRIE